MSADHSKITAIVPAATATRQQLEALAHSAPEDLVACVLDTNQPWWRRKPCAQALVGRLPMSAVPSMLKVAFDESIDSTIRVSVLEALTDPAARHAPHLLERLRSYVPSGGFRRPAGARHSYGLEEAIAVSRAKLGDLSVAMNLSLLASSAWRSKSEPGIAGLDTLIDTKSLATVVSALGANSLEDLAFVSSQPHLRLTGLRLLARDGGDLKPALLDSSATVASTACDLLSKSKGGDDQLFEMVRENGVDALWALVTLARRGHSIRDEWKKLGSPLVPLPNVPPDIRAAIVREYAPGERGTDPRWVLEQICVAFPPPPDEQSQLDMAQLALEEAGLAPQPPISAGDLNQQGDGTFHQITTNIGAVSISTLGPFCTVENQNGTAIAALESVGFRHIDPALGRTIVAGLHVYFFGAREPLSVADLLFYWQD